MKYLPIIFITVSLLALSRLNAQIAVIVNPDVSGDSISASQLRDIYTGDMTFWSNGVPIVVCDLNDEQSTHDQFYNFIAISSSRVKSIWMKRMLSGQSDPPLIFNSGKNLCEQVAVLPGAIGFVNESEVTGTVKIVLLIE
jgi:ABC-type phosphate transport system substrate-binding protein